MPAGNTEFQFKPGNLNVHSGSYDWADVASLAAPRSLLVLQCARDGLFPPEGMKDSVEKIAAVFERAGAKEKFSGRFYDEPHHYTRPMQDDAFAWFDRQLGGKS